MQKLSSTKRTWLWLVIFLLLLMVISYLASSGKPEDYANYDSHSPSPTGIKAIYTYLNDNQRPVQRWSYPPEYLSKQGNHQLLIMVEPYLLTDKAEQDGYEAFMKKGNNILLLKTNPSGMFGLKTKPVKEKKPDGGHDQIYDSQGHQYSANIHSPVRLQTKDRDVVLLHDTGGTIAMKRPFGKGSLIVANAPGWITNGRILKQDDLPLVQSLLQKAGVDKSAILFDEYSHGASHSPTLFTVYPKWLLIAGLQALLLVIIWLWLSGKRFGPIFVPREETVRFSDERIRALAAWYRRGRKYHDSLAIQADYVKFLLQERRAIPYRKNWTDIAGPLGTVWKSTSEHEIQAFLIGLTKILEKRQLNKQEYLLWSRRIDRLRKEINQRSTGS